MLDNYCRIQKKTLHIPDREENQVLKYSHKFMYEYHVWN